MIDITITILLLLIILIASSQPALATTTIRRYNLRQRQGHGNTITKTCTNRRNCQQNITNSNTSWPAAYHDNTTTSARQSAEGELNVDHQTTEAVVASSSQHQSSIRISNAFVAANK